MKRSTWLMISSVCLALTGTALAEDPKDGKAPAPAEDKQPARPKAGVTAEVKAGTGVEKHEIVGEGASFAAGTTVFVWTRVLGGEGNVKHVWKRDGKVAWTATLPLGSKRWSTQSRRAIAKAGSWEVDVQTDDGASLGTVAFTVN